MRVFLLCYHSIAPCTSKDVISASAICLVWRFISIDWCIGVGLHKFGLAISVIFPVALISIRCVVFTANDSAEIDCGHEL